ncbi:MAG TPA: glycosyltransferase family 8 protein [Candidatus Brocadiia bacterium]|nr:glycosyltransferase family 8 protein [Candidatus Brocadiia bacterium]
MSVRRSAFGGRLIAGRIIVALAADEAYFPGLLTTVVSIVCSTDPHTPLDFRVLDGGLRDGSWARLMRVAGRYGRDARFERIPVALERFSGFRRLFGSVMPYARLLLPALCPEERVIYVDTDILFLQDVRDLWAMSFDGKAAVASQDQIHWVLKADCPWLAQDDMTGDEPYFNSGLMLINLEEWRRACIAEQVMRLAEESSDRCAYADQTPLNFVLRGRVKLADVSWNRRPDKVVFPSDGSLPRVNIHYMAAKPWKKYSCAPGFAFWYAFHDAWRLAPSPAWVQYGLWLSRAKGALVHGMARRRAGRLLLDRLAKWVGKGWDASWHKELDDGRTALARVVSRWREERSQRMAALSR